MGHTMVCTKNKTKLSFTSSRFLTVRTIFIYILYLHSLFRLESAQFITNVSNGSFPSKLYQVIDNSFTGINSTDAHNTE